MDFMNLPPQAVQAPAPAPGVAPATPQPPAPIPIGITTSEGGPVLGIPQTAAEMATLRAQRRELSDQLVSARNRREDLADKLEGTFVVNRTGIEQQVRLLDDRILQIEGEIARTGRLVAGAQQHLFTGTEDPSPGPNVRTDFTAISIVLTIFVLAPIAVSMARLLWRRASGARPATPAFDRENTERLQRLEAAVESIAIEMERVSEGQRFVTKLLAEQPERERVRQLE